MTQALPTARTINTASEYHKGVVGTTRHARMPDTTRQENPQTERPNGPRRSRTLPVNGAITAESTAPGIRHSAAIVGENPWSFWM